MEVDRRRTSYNDWTLNGQPVAESEGRDERYGSSSPQIKQFAANLGQPNFFILAGDGKSMSTTLPRTRRRQRQTFTKQGA